VDTSPCDRGRAVPAAEAFGLPRDRRPLLRPALEQAILVGNAVASRATPLWPIIGPSGLRCGGQGKPECERERTGGHWQRFSSRAADEYRRASSGVMSRV